jgi:hypothetical protein
MVADSKLQRLATSGWGLKREGKNIFRWKKTFRPTPNTSHRPRAGRNVVEKAWYLNKQCNPWSQRYSSADPRLEEGAHRRSKVRRSRAGPKGSTPHENWKGNALCQKPDVGTDRGG